MVRRVAVVAHGDGDPAQRMTRRIPREVKSTCYGTAQVFTSTGEDAAPCLSLLDRGCSCVLVRDIATRALTLLLCYNNWFAEFK